MGSGAQPGLRCGGSTPSISPVATGAAAKSSNARGRWRPRTKGPRASQACSGRGGPVVRKGYLRQQPPRWKWTGAAPTHHGHTTRLLSSRGGGGCSPSPTTTPLAAPPTGGSHRAHNRTPGQRKARPGRPAHQSLWPCSHGTSHRVRAQVLNNQSVMQPIKCPGPNCSGVGHRPRPQTPCVPPARRLLTSGTQRKVETSQFSPPANCGFIREPGCRDQSRGSHAAPSHLPSCQKDRGPELPVHSPGSEHGRSSCRTAGGRWGLAEASSLAPARPGMHLWSGPPGDAHTHLANPGRHEHLPERAARLRTFERCLYSETGSADWPAQADSQPFLEAVSPLVLG